MGFECALQIFIANILKKCFRPVCVRVYTLCLRKRATLLFLR